MKRSLDRGQRDVDDGHIEYHHQLRNRDDSERQAEVTGSCCHSVSLLMRLVLDARAEGEGIG